VESHQISSGTNSLARLPAWAMVFLVAVAKVAKVVWVDCVAIIAYTSGKLRKEAKMEHAYTVLGKRITLTPETAEVLGSAVGAAAMLGPNKTQGVLELPDAELGRLFKAGISQFLTVSAQLPFSTSDSRKKRVAKPAAEPASRRLDPGTLEKSAFKMRSALVTSGQLLPAQEIWEGLQMTRQALAKAVATGRIFTVDVGAAQYYPAFYLSGEIDRKTLGKVTQQLGTLPGWSKWQFFTQPKASLGDMTPLQALARGQVAQVGRAAAAFAER
jgi:hypothetical protein